MITIPEEFVESTITREGNAGRKWITELPDLVNTLCKQWHLTIDGMVMHGYLGLAIPVIRDNEPCMLKVSWIDVTTKNEAIALKTWDGNGAVKLLQSQPAVGAMLLERLNFHRTLNNLEITEAIKIAGDLLHRLAVPDPGSLPTLQRMSADIANSLDERWIQSGRPMPKYLLDTAYDFAAQLGVATRDRVVNFDLHYLDVLAGSREPWLAIDPKVVIGDPEFGVAQLLWCRLEDIEKGGGLDYIFKILVETANLDAELARKWTIVRCVDYWLWGLSVGLTEDPARCEIITSWLLHQ